MEKGYDPFKFGEGVRRLVTRVGPDGVERLYKKAPSTDPKNIHREFRVSNYYMGTAVADALGCNLRCVFCWARDHLRDHTKIRSAGKFYSSSQVAEALLQMVRKDHLRYARMTEGEPTLDIEHLKGVLENLKSSKDKFTFIFETNGLILGRSTTLARELSEYQSPKRELPFLHVRVSIKGATPQKFRSLTFADSSFHKLQFDAIKNCLDEGLGVHPAVMLDFIESEDEIEYLRSELQSIDRNLIKDLEFERLFLEPYVMKRLKEYHIPFRMVFREGVRIWNKR